MVLRRSESRQNVVTPIGELHFPKLYARFATGKLKLDKAQARILVDLGHSQ